MLKNNQSIINLMESIPYKPVFFSSFLKKHYQKKLNELLINSMEDFNYPTFKLALYLGAEPNTSIQSLKDHHLILGTTRNGMSNLNSLNDQLDKNIKVTSQKGDHLVTCCTKNGEPLFLNTLLNFGGNVEANEQPGGYLPLHMAATKGMVEAIEVLIKHGADINAVYEVSTTTKKSRNPKGWTPLICACIHNKPEAVKKLLELGANPFDKNEKGTNAATICLNIKNKELSDYIIEKQKNFSILK